MRITDIELTVFDLETTDKDPETTWVCELGMAVFEHGAVVSRGNAGVNPRAPISDEARSVHKISNEDVKNLPTFDTFATRLASKFDNTPLLVGYNCRRFDARILDREFERAGSDWRMPMDKVLDLMPFVNWHHRGERERKQGVIAETIYGITADGGELHSAAVDTQLTGELLMAMIAAGLVPDDVDEALAEERRLAALVDEELERWSYWLYRDRSTRRLRMGAGKHCGRYLHAVEKRTLSWYLNNIDDLPENVRRAFDDARSGRLQNELQDDMMNVDGDQKVVVVGWGGWS